jgi:phosphoglucosamine mutase
VIDGDQIMAILAVAMKRDGRLKNDTLVATVMSNLGLHRAMAAQGIAVEQTAVGDRYVLERMNEGGFSLGGEQSGHVIMSRYATTGDGVLTGLHLCAEMARTGRSLAELASVMTVFPQVLINVRGVERSARPTPTSSPACRSPKRLGDSGGCCCARRAPSRWCASVMVEAQRIADADIADARTAVQRAGKRRAVARGALA